MKAPFQAGSHRRVSAPPDKRFLIRISILLGSLISGAGALAPAVAADAAPFPDAVRRELQPLRFAADIAPSEAVRAYWRFYGLDPPGARHLFGAFRSDGRNLAAHVFVPPSPTATVVLVHGYYDHAGVWRHLIPRLLEKGFAVVAYDQPGHGLSDGARASIADFAEYVTAFDDALALCQPALPPPYHIVAHSMGAGVVLDRLLRTPPDVVGHVVLLAPLVRSAHWGSSGLGHAVASRLVETVPRLYRDNSADPEFRRFVRQDPLQYDRLPTAWVTAHRAWVARMDKASPTQQPVTVLQGADDTTVDWKASLAWVRRVFPRAGVTLMAGAGHQLMNEAEATRTDAIRRVLEALAPAPPRPAP